MALILLIGVARPAAAADPIGVNAAVGDLRAALETLDVTFNNRPPEVREVLAADVKLVAQAIDATLVQIEHMAVPMVDATVLHDLDFLTDVVTTLNGELAALPSDHSTPLDPRVIDRISGLSSAAIDHLETLDRAVAAWQELNREAVVQVENQSGTIVVRTISRVVHEGVRFAGIALLLIGLLLIGLQLLRSGLDRGQTVSTRMRFAPLQSGLALIALAAFFGGALWLATDPGALAALSASTELKRQEHPCQRLDAQRDRLTLAQDLSNLTLIEASKRRMWPVARDCLGLPTQMAAVAAVDELAGDVVETRIGHMAADQASPPSAWTVPRLAGRTGGGSPSGVENEIEATGSTADEGTVARAMRVDALGSGPADEDAAGGITVSDALADLLVSLAKQEAADEAESLGAAPQATVEHAMRDGGTAATVAVDPSPAVTRAAPKPAEGGPATRPIAPGVAAEASAPEARSFVVTTGLNYRTRPDTGAPRLGAFPAGTEIDVLSEADGWAEVLLDDGRRAYVAREFLEPSP